MRAATTPSGVALSPTGSGGHGHSHSGGGHGHSHSGGGHGHSHSGGGHGHSHGGGDDDDGLTKPLTAKASAAATASTRARWQLIAAMVFCIFFMIAEVVGGYLAHSLAIMTDAAHLLSDVASFSISLFAVWLAERRPTMTQTYGYHRIEVFGAVLSVFLIWILTGVLLYEAVLRCITPQDVDGKIMFITAAAGVVVNLAMMKILHQGGGHGHSHGGEAHGHSHEGNINVRAAFIHAVGDLVQSVGVMLAAAIIWAVPSARIADPICTFLFSILVLFTTVGIMRTAARTLLNSVPASINLAALANELAAIPGVSNIHDLHVWAFGTSRIAMTVHIVADDVPAALAAAQAIAAAHDIGHSTMQMERCGTTDVANCYSYNEHIGDCAFVVEDPAAAAGGRAHSHGGSINGGGGSDGVYLTIGDGVTSSLMARNARRVIDRPTLQARHDTLGGCGALLSPPRSAGDAPSPASSHRHHHHHHHHHSHASANGSGTEGGEDRGHSHGGVACHGHGHGDASGGGEADHGHSHGGGADVDGGGEDHGHSHGGGADVDGGEDHGHSHGGVACHGHGHGGGGGGGGDGDASDGDDAHSHSHSHGSHGHAH